MKKKIVFIVLSVLLMLSATIYMAIHVSKTSQKSFLKSGYILNSEKLSGNDSEKTIKYYFNEEVGYKNSYDSTIEFKDTNGDKVKVSEASFVHYVDDSISVLKKGVIFNLDELNSAVPKYYNIFEGTILNKDNDTYQVDNLGKKLKFKRFIIRISDTKYLIVSNEIKLNIGDSKPIDVKSNYVELNFVEEGIIKIENQEATYQTIAKDATIYLGNNITLNLDNEYFFYKEEAKINLNQIIIDSNDNINISPLEDDKAHEDKDGEDDDETDNSNSNNGDGVNTPDAKDENSDTIYGDGSQLEEEIFENDLHIPTAVISDMSVTSNKMEATIKITDNDALIIGNSLTTITENSTGKIVYVKENDAGIYGIDVNVENLNPETVYSLTTSVTYKKHDVEYSVDIISQLFCTDSLGIDITKDYFSSDELSFYVKIQDYSKVKSADIVLLTSTGTVINTVNISDELAKDFYGQKVVFSELSSDTKYSVVVNNILYDNYVVSNDYSLEISAKTLKKRPTMGDTDFSIDKKNSNFTLKLNNMVDPDKGVENYRYEIYDARTISSGAQPVEVIEKNNTASVDLDIDDKIIYRGVPYVFKVVAEFYDNEKYIEYSSAYSNTMQMDGVKAPSVSWEAKEITFERISGIITINDEANTVDWTKNMTIVYTNSVGISNSFIAEGNSVIPFNVNNLRANESYTISVYASVNFQDGNSTVDKYHVGSIVVKTNPTNSFDTSFDIDSNNVESAFTIRARLLNVKESDNTLEATTLTGITFTLYEGNTVSGRVVKTITKMDRDLREYYSDLKSAYYDNTFVLEPSFFGFKNADLTSEYYTISISNAYDYTDFKNEIPIENNVVSVKTNGFIPDLPNDVDNAIDYELIYNKDAGDKMDASLEATTVVGIRVKAIYDNAKRYAKNINYHVFDADTNKELEDYKTSFTIGDDGVIEYVSFWFGKGTKYNVTDDELTRGHRYYFTYDAKLDLNFDGIAETRYPTNETVKLKSGVISIPKQAAKIITYPSISSANTMTFKYKYVDIDNSLIENKLYAGIGSSVDRDVEVDSKKITQTAENYNSVKFENLKEGYLRIYSNQALLKKDSSIEEVKYVYQYFEGIYTPKPLSYTVMLDVNRIIVSINDYDKEQESLKRIAALKLTFECEGKKVIKDYVKLDSGNAVVDMFDLSSFLGKTVKLQVEAYYDTGIVGFDINDSYYALQAVANEYGGGEYLNINALGNLSESNIAMGAIYEKEMNSTLIKLTNLYSQRSISINKKPDAGGILFNYGHILLKKLETVTYVGDDTSTFTFKQIIPGISLRNEDGIEEINSTIRSVSFKANIFGYGASNIKDSLIYMQLFETDANGFDLKEVDTYSYTLEQLKDVIVVDGLYPKQNYAMQFYAYVDDGNGSFVKKRLYDLDDNTDNKTYYFKTLSSVDIFDINVKYVAESYSDKHISLSYSLGATMGFDRIKYTLYKRVYNQNIGDYEFVLMDKQIADEDIFKKQMNLDISCNPGSEFVFGNQYKIVITPIVDFTTDGVTTAIPLDDPADYTFTLTALHKPYVGVNSTISSKTDVLGNTLDFRVNVYDTDKVIVGGTYRVKVTTIDGKDITPDEYAGKDFSISTYNRVFTVGNLEQGNTYLFSVIYNGDSNNDIVSAKENVVTYRANSLNNDAIDIGEVTSSASSSSKSKVDLVFKNSYRLTMIDKIRYSIYSSSDGSSQDNEMVFEPIQKKVDNNDYVYTVTLPETLPVNGVYYIQIQFINDDFVVSETTVEHIYITS